MNKRVTECLKRVGPRGSQQWQSIPFEQLIEEIVVGGNLFGEGAVEGLQDIYGQEPLDPHNPEYGPKSNQLLVMEATDLWPLGYSPTLYHECFWYT